MPTDPHDLVAQLESTGIDRVQLALDPLRENPELWGQARDSLQQAGISIISGMFGTVGEDYSTLDSIRVTGGIAPDATWPQNLANIRATAEIAAELKLPLVTFHAGFVPHDPADPDFSKMVERLAAVADVFAGRGIRLALETGQETAEGLKILLETLDHPAVGVNFDPANMLLYGKGDPVEALHVLGPWIRQVHIKDAIPSSVSGQWGEEVAAGHGRVDWPAFFTGLDHAGFAGDLVIEREAGSQRVADIRLARDLILKTLF